ncbi:MAG: hypothetical protein JXX29_20035 [Deltaproteobacteria bacterium]|nr:hypothetical protein [Deltaproteobacteria bacterium]MBN2673982.1 hypothetical protein [Deltaproteobacteria bacterium]
MSRIFVRALASVSLLFIIVSCKSEPPAPVEPVAPPPAPVPVADTEEEDTGTETETATEPELPPTEEPTASKSSGISKSSLIGNYSCSISGENFPMGIVPPPAMCKIYEGSGDDLKIAPVGGSGINGTISNIRGGSFSVVGNFDVGVGKLKINARLSRRSSTQYKGKGTGELAGATIPYNLTLIKK